MRMIQRPSTTTLLVLLLALLTCHSAGAAGADVYRQVVPATAFVYVRTEDGYRSGSGALISREEKTVVTAAHVVRDAQEVTVFFAASDNGRPVTDSSYYVDRFSSLKIKATILAVDEARDVALLNLETLPDGTPAIPLATASPLPGDALYAIGNSSFDLGGAFGLVAGAVRNVYRRSADGVRVIDSNLPTNRGDSGGPVINERGELVGIVSAGTVGDATPESSIFHGKQLLDHSIDVSEIQLVFQKNVGSQPPAKITSAKPRQDSPVSGLTEADWEILNETFSLLDRIKPALEEAAAAQPANEQDRIEQEHEDAMMQIVRDSQINWEQIARDLGLE